MIDAHNEGFFLFYVISIVMELVQDYTLMSKQLSNFEVLNQVIYVFFPAKITNIALKSISYRATYSGGHF